MDESDGAAGSREAREARTAITVAILALAVIWATAALFSRGALAAGPFENPHGSYTTTTDSCATCHRSHTGQNRNILKTAAPQSSLCLACHDGTGANANTASQYSDGDVPADDAATSSFYRHPALTSSSHTRSDLDEFAGVLNRHSECGDCHDPHALSTAAWAIISRMRL